MKKKVKKLMALMLTIAMLMGMTVNVNAAPTVYPDPIMEGLQVIYGEIAPITFFFDYDGYSNCRFDLKLYDSDNDLLEELNDYAAEKTGYDLNYITMSLKTEVYSAGKYKVYIYGEYYKDGSWKKAEGNPVIFTINVVKKNSNLNGFAIDNNSGFYYKNGAVDTGFTGFTGGTNKYFYVKNGEWAYSYTGAVYDEVGKSWKYVEDGLWFEGYVGTAYAPNGDSIIFDANGVGREACAATGGAHNYENSVCTGCGNLIFDDVENGRYYMDPLKWAVKYGITTGMSETTFVPDGDCTRAQVVTFLWRSAGSPEPKVSENPFTDVAEGKWYTKAVMWAVENGITTGMTDTTFEPDKPCTRGQIATFLHRHAGNPLLPLGTKNPFSDVLAGRFYWGPVMWAYSNNVTTGVTATTFEPDTTCTRGQIVTFLYRFYANN